MVKVYEAKNLLKVLRFLEDNEIPFELGSVYRGFMIGVPTIYGERQFDIILHDGSYGHQSGLLEIAGCIVNEEEVGDSVEGYLTAWDVIKRITKFYDVDNMKK